jgi:hypothetical protein
MTVIFYWLLLKIRWLPTVHNRVDVRLINSLLSLISLEIWQRRFFFFHLHWLTIFKTKILASDLLLVHQRWLNTTLTHFDVQTSVTIVAILDLRYNIFVSDRARILKIFIVWGLNLRIPKIISILRYNLQRLINPWCFLILIKFLKSFSQVALMVLARSQMFRILWFIFQRRFIHFDFKFIIASYFEVS